LSNLHEIGSSFNCVLNFFLRKHRGVLLFGPAIVW